MATWYVIHLGVSNLGINPSWGRGGSDRIAALRGSRRRLNEVHQCRAVRPIDAAIVALHHPVVLLIRAGGDLHAVPGICVSPFSALAHNSSGQEEKPDERRSRLNCSPCASDAVPPPWFGCYVRGPTSRGGQRTRHELALPATSRGLLTQPPSSDHSRAASHIVRVSVHAFGICLRHQPILGICRPYLGSVRSPNSSWGACY